MITAFLPRNPNRAGSIPILVEVLAGTVTANTTTTHRGPAIPSLSYLAKAIVSCSTVGADADGTILLTLKKYDASANAAVTLSSAFDLETLTANEGALLTILSTLTDEQRRLDVGDTLFFEIVSNSAAFNTAPVGIRVDIELLVMR